MRTIDRRDRREFCLAAASMLGWSGTCRADRTKIRLGPGSSLLGERPFPNTDPWNLDISRVPVDPHSDALIRTIGLDKSLHADFGTVYDGRPIGIPYTVVPGSQPRVPIRFEYAEESDPGPYPIPPDITIEGGADAPPGGDRHALIIDRDAWKLYELFALSRDGTGWKAGSGAIFDLAGNTERPLGHTSADAAGLPIFPGLVRYDEVMDGHAIRHALRFTCSRVRRAFVPPARHFVNNLRDPSLPPLGMRVRLKASFNDSKFPGPARVILRALKTHGMILADVGGDWFVSGAPNPRWDDDAIGSIRQVQGRDLEVVRMGKLSFG